MSEPDICMSKIPTENFWSHLKKMKFALPLVNNQFTDNEEVLPYIHTWDHVSASSSKSEGKSPILNKSFDSGIKSLHVLKKSYDSLFTKTRIRSAAQPVYLYQAERLANLLVDKNLNFLERDQSESIFLQTHMTMRAFRFGGIDGTLHAIGLILNVDKQNKSFRLDVFDSNGDFRKLYFMNENNLICCVGDITNSMNGFEIIKPPLRKSKTIVHRNRDLTVNWFKKFVFEYPDSDIAKFGLIDICLNNITLSKIKSGLKEKITDIELKDKLHTSYLEISTDRSTGLAFLVKSSVGNNKYYVLTRREKKVREGVINPISDFIEMRQYEAFMTIFIQILNSKIRDAFVANGHILSFTNPIIICREEICNEGLNLRGSGCNTWSLFYHWIRVNYTDAQCEYLLKKISNLTNTKSKHFELDIFKALETGNSTNYDTNLNFLIEKYLNSEILRSAKPFVLENNCLFGGSKIKTNKNIKKTIKKKRSNSK